MGRIYLKAEDLQKFWDEHRPECSENFLKISHYYNYENDLKRYSGLEVSGVSRLVTVCRLEKYGSHNYSEEHGKMVDTPPVWNNETTFLALENIKTGKLYRASGSYRDTTFSLFLLDAKMSMDSTVNWKSPKSRKSYRKTPSAMVRLPRCGGRE